MRPASILQKIVCITLLSINNPLFGQNKAPSNSGAAATVAAAGAAVAIGAISIAAAWEQWVESAELSAAEYYMKNTPNQNSPFELKLLNSQGSSFNDLSTTTTLVFSITEYDLESSSSSFINPRKKILVLFLNGGWINSYGVDFTKVIPEFFTLEEWSNLYKGYLNMSGNPKIESLTEMNLLERVSEKEYLKESQKAKYAFSQPNSDVTNYFVSRGTKVKLDNRIIIGKTSVYSQSSEYIIQQRILVNGDTYIREDFNSRISLIFNENKLGVYLKEHKVLIQLKNSVLNEINSFFF